jgi:hypothetical protein
MVRTAARVARRTCLPLGRAVKGAEEARRGDASEAMVRHAFTRSSPMCKVS